MTSTGIFERVYVGRFRPVRSHDVSLSVSTSARPVNTMLRRRLRILAGRRVSADGWLVIEANRFRSQARNRDDARHRLVELIRKAAHPPKTRKPTRPTVGSKERRLKDKRTRGEAKQARSKRGTDEG